MPAMMGNGEPGIGSNSWVVAGSRTSTGKPLLANDPHLAPHMPSLWYQMGLHCRQLTGACPLDVTGFGFSGVPGIVIGRSDRIAWGFTNLGPDVTDLYLERISGGTYEYKGRRELAGRGLDRRPGVEGLPPVREAAHLVQPRAGVHRHRQQRRHRAGAAARPDEGLDVRVSRRAYPGADHAGPGAGHRCDGADRDG
jgi:hypothetical protein